MSTLLLYGPNWSAYTRTVRLVLIEKEVRYALKEVDFSNGIMPADHFKLHPFGKVPVLIHDGFVIYETSAICRYIDEAFVGPELQPSDVQQRARMAQVIAIVDNYLSEPIRMGFFNELLIKPKVGLASDNELAESAQNYIQKGFAKLCELLEGEEYLVGQKISLADLHAAPLFDFIDMTPGGGNLISSQPKLHDWWMSIKTQPSVENTKPDLSVFNIA